MKNDMKNKKNLYVFSLCYLLARYIQMKIDNDGDFECVQLIESYEIKCTYLPNRKSI